MKVHIENYLTYLESIKHVSTNTRASYESDLKRLLNFLVDQGIDTFEKMNETILNSYILYLEKMNLSDATVARSLSSLKKFVFYLIKQGIIHEDPTERMKAPKVLKKPIKYLTLEKVDTLLSLPKQTSWLGIRDKAMLELMYATGIKVSELLELEVEDVNLNIGFIKCINVKKERIIPIGSMAKKALISYIEIRNEKISHCNKLFLNRQGNTMTRQGFWKIIKKYGDELPGHVEISPQVLRHSFAFHLVQNGADLSALKELMGYQDILSTQVYLDMKGGKVKEIYNKAHPRA